MIKIYHYDENTKVYIGEGVAVEDPHTGHPILPAHCTTLQPPTSLSIFNEDAADWDAVAVPAAKAQPVTNQATTAAPAQSTKVEREPTKRGKRKSR